jgi:hypothetical protein
MAVNLTQLLEGVDSVELCNRKNPEETPGDSRPALLVHRDDDFLAIGLEAGMADAMIAALLERFPDWLASWPEPPNQSQDVLCGTRIRPGQPWLCTLPLGHGGECISSTTL